MQRIGQISQETTQRALVVAAPAERNGESWYEQLTMARKAREFGQGLYEGKILPGRQPAIGSNRKH